MEKTKIPQDKSKSVPRTTWAKKPAGYFEKDQRQTAMEYLARGVPPHDLEAEYAVLGGILTSEEVKDQALEQLAVDDWYSPAHRTIFQGVVELSEKNDPVDYTTLSSILEEKGELDRVGGRIYVIELGESVLSPASALFHLKTVKDKSIHRKVLEASTAATVASFEISDTDEMVAETQRLFFNLAGDHQEGLVHGSVGLSEVISGIHERADSGGIVMGFPSGLNALDRMTLGFQPSDLIILAGRPSMGKTACALGMALKGCSKTGKAAVVFSLEMSLEQLHLRNLSIQSGVSLMRLREGNMKSFEWQQIYNTADHLSSLSLYMDDTPALSTLELFSRCRRLHSRLKGNLGLVVIDYLQLMRASVKTQSREQEVAEISRQLKALAKELNVPVIALSQLNRKLEERTDKRPIMSDLRESGAIEQDADIIMFVYRDAVYNKAEDNPLKNQAEIIVAKQRNGPIGKVAVHFDKECARFSNLASEGPPV